MSRLRSALVVSIGMALATLGLGCSDGSSGSGTDVATVVRDAERHHLGKSYKPGFTIPAPEGIAKKYTFILPSRVSAGRIQLKIYDMDNLGADIQVNGQSVRTVPPPGGDAQLDFTVAGALFVVGANTATVRSLSSGAQYEDFEYEGFVVQVEYSDSVKL